MRVAHPNTENPELIVYRTIPNNIYNTIKEYSGYYTNPKATWVAKMAEYVSIYGGTFKKGIGFVFSSEKNYTLFLKNHPDDYAHVVS
jgi:hypothetical protein